MVTRFLRSRSWFRSGHVFFLVVVACATIMWNSVARAGDVVCIPPVSGVYQISGGVTLATFCQTPPQITFSLLEFIQDGTVLTVLGPNVAMVGTIDIAGQPITFDVTGQTSVGSCVQTWSLAGTFVDEIPRNEWTGQLSITFSGCACTSLSGNVTATRSDPDCNGNGIHDECDLDCGPVGGGCDVPGCGQSADCNANCIPDDCDGLDESVFVSWVGGNGMLWTESSNWCPAGVPNNIVGEVSYDVSIPNSGDVTLDISCFLDRMTITDNSILSVRAASGGDRTIEVITAIENAGGTIAARDGRTATILDTTINGGRLLAGAGGLIVLDNSTANGVALSAVGGGNIQVINDGTLIDPTIDALEVPDAERGFIEGVVSVSDGGAIRVNAMTGPTSLEPTLESSTITLAGGGALKLIENPGVSAARAVFGSATATLDIVDSNFEISGVGRVDALSVANSGRIAADTSTPGRALNLLAFDVENTGEMFVGDGAAMFVLGDVNMTQAGRGVVDGAAELDVLGALTLSGGATLGPTDNPSTAELGLGGLTLRGTTGAGAAGVGTAFNTDGEMSTFVFGDVEASGDCTGLLQGGCTPPSIGMMGQSSMSASNVVISGDGTASDLQTRFTMRDNATLFVAQSLRVEPGGSFEMIDNAAEGALSAPTAFVEGDVSLGTCEGLLGATDSFVGGCTPPGVVGGCTPPSIGTMGNAQLSIGGSLILEGVANVVIQGQISLAGDFVNHLSAPGCFDFDAGVLEMNGSAVQSFEVAGEDRGAVPGGLNQNVAIGTFVLDTGTTVRLVDQFTNQSSAGPCEALYTETLILNAGSSLLCDCPIYYVSLINGGGDLCDSASQIPACLNDCDGDGDVDLFDFQQFQTCIEKSPASNECRTCFDCNGDGFVGLADVGRFQLAFEPPIR